MPFARSTNHLLIDRGLADPPVPHGGLKRVEHRRHLIGRGPQRHIDTARIDRTAACVIGYLELIAAIDPRSSEKITPLNAGPL